MLVNALSIPQHDGAYARDLYSIELGLTQMKRA